MTSRIIDDILKLCNHIVWRSKVQHWEIRERTARIMAIMEEVEANNFANLFPRLKELKTKKILLQQQEE